MRRHDAAGSILFLTGAGAGLSLFWHEHSITTVGSAWLIGVYTYLNANHRRDWLGR
jgi:hypothetical protein